MAMELRNPIDIVKDEIEQLFDDAVAGLFVGKPVPIGKLTAAGRAYLQHLSGETMKPDVDFVLNPSDLVHIYNRHYGSNEKDGRNIPLDIEDIRNISDIITFPDKVIYAKENGGNGRTMFFFLKETDGGSYNLLEIYTDNRGNMTSKSLLKSREGVSQRAMLLKQTPTLTSVTDGATLDDGTNIPQIFGIIKHSTQG